MSSCAHAFQPFWSISQGLCLRVHSWPFRVLRRQLRAECTDVGFLHALAQQRSPWKASARSCATQATLHRQTRFAAPGATQCPQPLGGSAIMTLCVRNIAQLRTRRTPGPLALPDAARAARICTRCSSLYYSFTWTADIVRFQLMCPGTSSPHQGSVVGSASSSAGAGFAGGGLTAKSSESESARRPSRPPCRAPTPPAAPPLSSR